MQRNIVCRIINNITIFIIHNRFHPAMQKAPQLFWISVQISTPTLLLVHLKNYDPLCYPPVPSYDPSHTLSRYYPYNIYRATAHHLVSRYCISHRAPPRRAFCMVLKRQNLALYELTLSMVAS